jgi:hypothetical protein
MIANKRLMLLFCAWCWASGPSQAAADIMDFSTVCMGNAVESCHIVAEGEIDAGTPERF